MTSFCCSLLMLGSSFFFRKAMVLLRFLSLSLSPRLSLSLSLSLFLSVCPVLLLLLPYHAVLPGQETLDDAAVGLLAELAERLGRGHGTLFFFRRRCDPASLAFLVLEGETPLSSVAGLVSVCVCISVSCRRRQK